MRSPPSMQVGAQDAEVVVGDVGEGRAAVDVAEGVDSGDVGLQALVDRDVAALVQLDAGRRRVRAGRCSGCGPRRPAGGVPFSVRSPSGVSTVTATPLAVLDRPRTASLSSRISMPSSRRISATASATSGSSRPSRRLPR